MRFLFRWLLRGVLLAVVLGTAALLAKDILLREWVLYRLRAVTGLETHLQSLRSAWLSGSMTLTDLRLDNAAEFGGGLLVSIPDLHLELDTGALRRRELRFRLGRLHLAEFNLVRNARGETNVVALLAAVQERASVVDAVIVSPPGLTFTGFERLNLTLGTARMLDLAQPAANRELRIGVTNEILHDIRTSSDLTPLLLRVMLRELGEQFAPRPEATPAPRRPGP